MKIKENVRIYNNILMTFWYEKQLKQTIKILIFIFISITLCS